MSFKGQAVSKKELKPQLSNEEQSTRISTFHGQPSKRSTQLNINDPPIKGEKKPQEWKRLSTKQKEREDTVLKQKALEKI